MDETMDLEQELENPDAPNGVPAQGAALGGERRSSGVSEAARLRGDERYGACDADDDGQGGVVGPQVEEDADELDAAGAGAGTGDEQPGDAGREQHREQTRQDNAAARAARLRAESETRDRLQREYDEKVAGLGVINPYTGQPIKSFGDFEAYGEQFRREKLAQEARRQGKSVEELAEEQENRSFIARKRKEEADQKAAMAELKNQQEFLKADLMDFQQKYPDIDVTKLEKNPKFVKFAGKRLYREPLAELYGDFVDLVSDAERAAVERKAGKQARSTGGGLGGGGESLSPAQAAELEAWNRENPELRMTAKEFLAR